MKTSDSHQPSHTNNLHSDQPFFGAKAEQAFFGKGRSPAQTFFNSSNAPSAPIQAKLMVGTVGDRYEQEADNTAPEVVSRISNPVVQQGSNAQTVQRVGEQEEDLQTQRSPLPPQQLPQHPASKTPSAMVSDRAIQAKAEITSDRQDSSVEQHPNKTGMPDALKAGVESLSGYSLDHVRVHYNSPKPAQLKALAYTQGTEIHVASGQEEYLPHEAWHVVQQAQGRVQPTMQMKNGVPVNDDAGLEQEADIMGAQSLATDRLPHSICSLRPTPNLNASVIQGAFTYTASVIIDRPTAASQKADQLKITKIALPGTHRPPTQYGQKQQAHSVSWTLLKKSYEAIETQTINTFIDDYLKKDWQALKKQEEMGKSEDSQNLFKTYLNKYNDAYFEDLKTKECSFLRWYGIIQKNVTDYFVALQLAPLSTHTGYSQEIGTSGALSTGVIEHQPLSHGEPAANDFFKDLEAKGGTGKEHSEVVSNAKRYWDPGIGKANGINESNQIDLILEEFETAFARAYPKTWKNYKDGDNGIQKKLSAAARAEVALLSGRGHSKPGKSSDTDDEVEDDSSGSFQAQVNLEDSGGGKASAEQFEIKEFEVKEIALPDDRPVTKYGIAGQKSHTVSWTLILESLNALGKEQPLKPFLQALLLKWIGLSNQDWAGMLDSNLITSTDFSSRKSKPITASIEQYNKNNKKRLEELQDKIAPQIKKLTDAIAGKAYTDQKWGELVQTALSEYVLVYQSSPLTTYKAEKAPKGHGEPDANKYLGWIEREHDGNLATWALKEKSEKFIADLYKDPQKPPVKSRWQGQDDKEQNNSDDANSALTIAKIIHPIVSKTKKDVQKLTGKIKGIESKGSLTTEETEQIKKLRQQIETLETQCQGSLEAKLSKEQLTQMNKILVKQLALKYLDVSWGAVLKNGVSSLDYSPQQLARILIDWEEALKEAYPKIWQTYKAVFEDYSNQYKLSPALLEQAQSKGSTETTLQSWTTSERREREYLRGLVSIKSGDEASELGASTYNQGKQDYDQGRRAAQTDPTVALPANQPIGYNHGYQDYQDGYRAAATNPSTPLEAGRNLAYKMAYHDYNSGIAAAKAGTLAANGGQVRGHNDYLAGITAAQNNTAVLTHGAQIGHNDYHAGIAAARKVKPGTTEGAVQGGREYDQGYDDGRGNFLAAGISVAYRAGFTDGQRDWQNQNAKVNAYNIGHSQPDKQPKKKQKIHT